MFLLSKLCFLWISSIVPICNDFQTLLFYLPDGRHYGKDPFSQCCSYFRFALFFLITSVKRQRKLCQGVMSHVFQIVEHFLLTFSLNFKTTLSLQREYFFFFCFITRVRIALMTMWRFWKVLMGAPIL